jgi:ribosomal protein L35
MHKTHKGLTKRIKVSGSKKNKKLLHFKKGDNHHLRTNKSSTKKQIKGKISIIREIAN